MLNIIKHVAAENYPRLRERLGEDTPVQLSALGNLNLLSLPKTALFCPDHCPDNVTFATRQQASKWRDTERCVISGFHSPVEKECLQILVRDGSPVILCPARAILERLPAQWAIAVSGGRMLILSCFPMTVRRVTAKHEARRDEFVAAFADDIFLAYDPGGYLEALALRMRASGVPLINDITTLEST